MSARAKKPTIVPCPGWTPTATSRYPTPETRPCTEGHVNQAILQPHQVMCSRCAARKTKWDREHYSYEDARIRRERRDTMKLERSVARIREAVPTIAPFEVIPAIEALLIPYEYDPDKDAGEQEAAAVASGKYPLASKLDSNWRWKVLRGVYGLGPEDRS